MGYRFGSSAWSALWAVGLAVFWPFSGSVAAECECDQADIIDALQSADWIFGGQIVRAALNDDGETIDFTVEVVEPIRGQPSATVDLRTLPEARCGIAVSIGFTELFAVNEGDPSVSRCTGSGRALHIEQGHLRRALLLIEYSKLDKSAAVEKIRRVFQTGYPKENMREFFTVVGALDHPGAIVEEGDNIRYGELVFEFRGEELHSIK